MIHTLSKIFKTNIIKYLGMFSMDEEKSTRDLLTIQSYIKLFKERYTFVKNSSTEMVQHPDPEFLKFVKTEFFDGIVPKKLKFVQLPIIPGIDISDDPGYLLYSLLSMFTALLKTDNKHIIILLEYLMNKIVTQDQRRYMYNFAKLKSQKMVIVEDDDGKNTEPEDEDEENIFDAYDLDDDLDDNINGEY